MVSQPVTVSHHIFVTLSFGTTTIRKTCGAPNIRLLSTFGTIARNVYTKAINGQESTVIHNAFHHISKDRERIMGYGFQ